MKPHFIFNTLGAIRTMIKSSPDKAYNLTTSFSKYLRANINNISPTETISFAQEMDHVKTYVDIEKQRFGDRLTVLYDINCENFNIPPLTVEPLVENAVKHGVCKRVKGGTVKISSREEEDKYIVTVEDDGVGFDVQELNDETGSVGLKYIKLRLKELSNADFKIESKKGVGTIATLTFFK
jgi:sensor histidine kinase YesM